MYLNTDGNRIWQRKKENKENDERKKMYREYSHSKWSSNNHNHNSLDKIFQRNLGCLRATIVRIQTLFDHI